MKLLKLFDFITDDWMVCLQYRLATGRWLHVRKPQRYTEKLQCYKLYYHDPLMTRCADKRSVRDYVSAKGYADMLIPLYHVYECVDDIMLDDLPAAFVLKTTNGSKTNIIVKDKTTIELASIQATLTEYLQRWSGKNGREWAYYDIPPRIICEEYLKNDAQIPLLDYKFYCFQGKPHYLYLIEHRDGIVTEGYYGIFDMDFQRLPYKVPNITFKDVPIAQPAAWDQMKQMAQDLAADFPHVRVDLYCHNEHIYFGELTFYHGSGHSASFPGDDLDWKLGELFVLPERRCK